MDVPTARVPLGCAINETCISAWQKMARMALMEPTTSLGNHRLNLPKLASCAVATRNAARVAINECMYIIVIGA